MMNHLYRCRDCGMIATAQGRPVLNRPAYSRDCKGQHRWEYLAHVDDTDTEEIIKIDDAKPISSVAAKRRRGAKPQA